MLLNLNMDITVYANVATFGVGLDHDPPFSITTDNQVFTVPVFVVNRSTDEPRTSIGILQADNKCHFTVERFGGFEANTNYSITGQIFMPCSTY